MSIKEKLLKWFNEAALQVFDFRRDEFMSAPNIDRAELFLNIAVYCLHHKLISPFYFETHVQSPIIRWLVGKAKA